ncbi:MAG: hypothetical protein GYB66_02365 [Chloroflexi bacterium]|nr:hypothetical protein [Chloroflexota bacterium]
MTMAISRRTLVLLVGLLLLHLLVRAHNILTLPLFVDEQSHLTRAEVIYSFDHHPAKDSHGKFLFYFLPGIFDLESFKDETLHLGRTSVALASLLTGALVFAIGSRLFDARVGLAATAIYALLPYASFFERMALADPFAGLIATALVWQSIRFVSRPSRSRALWVGLFMALAPAAKLTMSFVDFVPIIAVLLFGSYDSLVDLVRRYWRYGLWAAGVVIGFWAMVFIPALIDYTRGTDYVFYTPWLLETPVESSDSVIVDKLGDKWEKLVLLTSLPMTILFLIGPWLVKREQRKATLLVSSWLLATWFVSFFLVGYSSFQSRYMTAGSPALVLLLAVGAFAITDRLFPRRATIVAGLGWAVWAAVYALPFSYTAATDPTRLDMPWLDQHNYFESLYNAYGLIEAMDAIRADAEGEVTVVLGTRFTPRLFEYENLEYHRDREFNLSDADRPRTQQLILEPLAAGEPVYLVTDTYVDERRPDFPPMDGVVAIEFMAEFEKPYGANTVKVWRLREK